MVFVYLGLAFSGVALICLLRQDWLLLVRPRRRTRGAVYDHRRSIDDGADSFAPMVRFTADAGQTIEFVDIVYSSSPLPPVGETVEVIYPEGHPGLARIPRPWTRGLVYLAVVGMLLILVARALNLLPESGTF